MAVKKAKVMDKWKMKKWYSVLAPQLFENREICELVSASDSSLLNRIIKINMMELMPSNSHTSMFTTLKFRISEVKGNNAYTKLIGHEIAPTYIKTFARRGKTIVHRVVDIKTKDGETVRVKVLCVTTGKISNMAGTNMRSAIVDETAKKTDGLGFDEVMQELLYGRVVSKIYTRLKQITSIKRVEVIKSERSEKFK